MVHLVRIRFAGVVALSCLAGAACTKGQAPQLTLPQQSTGGGTEWVDYHTQVPITPTDFDSLASGMFGANAQAGQFLSQKPVNQSFFITSVADPSTPTQTRLTFAFDDGTSTPRVLATTPASYSVGGIFIKTCDAAIAQMQADVTSQNAGGEIFNIVYTVTSTQGGTLAVTLNGNQGTYSLSLDVTSPHTSLQVGQIGMAATDSQPYDTVSGTVWFGISNDEFDYFVDHAYGADATSGQNFSDFALTPYQWLRLTVTPNLPENIVNVAFVVLATDGTRVPVAQAPASVMAGSTFQALVDRAMAVMTAQEKAQAGSSTPWTIPFYYDEPQGGGVVQVIAQGSLGQFEIAYSVASPQNMLTDVPFVPYKTVTFPPPNPNQAKPCYQQGLPGVTQSLTGVFQITFTLSSVITTSLNPGQQLQGDIGCSIYDSSEVNGGGPLPGAQSMLDFTVPAANMTGSTPVTYTTTKPLPDGSYQILSAQYVDGNDNNADKGDPVTLPIGAYPLACNINPATVQFAILLPSNE
jgi:hypothetical protein